MVNKPRVGLEPGHGTDTFPGSGKGVYKDGKGYAEHSFNSKLVIAIDELLKANGVDALIYQKPFAKDIPLTQRTNYYNNKKVDLVYSIHANYNSDYSVNGRCVFYWHTAKDSKKLADIVVDEIKKAGYSTHGNGLHASEPGSWTDLHICRETDMTAVLVENGFMSGSQDFDLVFGSKQSEYIKDMAQVHAKSICKYFGVDFEENKDKPNVHKPKPGQVKPNKIKEYKGNSIVDYLNTKGINSSLSNRKKLAKEYGVSNYAGTASKNTELLNKMREGKPVSKPKVAVSVVNWMNAKGMDSSLSNRSKLASRYGIKGYRGTATQNMSLLNNLRGGAPKQGTVHLPKSAKTWRTYKLTVQPIKKNSDWMLSPSKFGGLTYDVLDKPYQDVVTIRTDKGKRNIFVGKGTNAVIK